MLLRMEKSTIYVGVSVGGAAVGLGACRQGCG